MTDEEYVRNISSGFHTLARIAIPEKARDLEALVLIGEGTLAAVLDFARHEPGYFAAMVRFGTQGQTQADTEYGRKMWRDLVTTFPLASEEQAG